MTRSTVTFEKPYEWLQGIEEREGRHQQEVIQPWQYDTKKQARQHLRKELAYPEDSPLRYNHITSRGLEDERDIR